MSKAEGLGILGGKEAEARAKYIEVIPDPICELLPDDAVQRYLGMSRVQVRLRLVEILRNTPRWVDDDSDKDMDPDFKENDLDHVLELLIMANDVEANYHHLYMELTDGNRENWLILLSALIIHDVGETVTGDISRTHSGFNGEIGRKRKLREARAAKKLIHWGVAQKAEDLVKIYERYDQRDENDKLIRFGHVLDKGQATANVALHVLPFNKGRKSASYSYIKDMIESIQATMDHAELVANELKTAEAVKELASFLEKHILGFYRPLIAELPPEDAQAVETAINARYRNIFRTL